MPSSIELNVGHVPSPRRQRAPDDGDGTAPFRILVLGDFSGCPRAERGALGERRVLRIDIDNFETVFARLAPRVAIAGLQDKQGQALHIELGTMDDLSADAVLARLPAEALARAGAPAPASPAPASASSATADDPAALMQRLLGGQLPASAPAMAAVPAAAKGKADEVVDRLIRQLVSGASSAPAQAPAPATGSNEVAAALLRHVLRDASWRHLEGAWRAVDRFVRELDMADGSVRLELLDVRADELLADLSAAAGDPARAAVGAALKGGGRGCDVVVSLEEYGPSLPELSLLGGLAAAAAAHGAVLLAGAAPALAAVATSEDVQVLASNESRVWRALRASALASHVGLTFPRLIARLPYGPRHDPVAAFPFDELADVAAASLHDHLPWRSAALDAALLLAQGYVDGGVESRLQLPDLPAFIDRSGDEPQLQPVAEAWIGERESGVLQAAGLIALQSDRRMPHARVSAWQSIATDGHALAGSWR